MLAHELGLAGGRPASGPGAGGAAGWASASRAGLEVLRGGATGFGLGAAQLLALDPGLGLPSALAADDLDRDGRPDLVVASAD